MIGDLSHTVFDAAFMRGVPVICGYLDDTWINRFGAALW